MSEPDNQQRVLKLKVFGTWQACLRGEPLPPLRSRKGEWLLALLAIRGAPVSRSWLAGTLWPESEESRALLYLRRELTYLRKAFGAECDRLIRAGRSLQLDLTCVDCDLVTFDTTIAMGDESSLELAVSLYVGPVLEGCDEEWAIIERRARELAYLNALELLSELAAERGDASASIRHLRSAVAQDPLRESVQRSLMKTLFDTGDSAAAIQVYRNLRAHLVGELNAEPDPETTDLFHRIRDKAGRQRQAASQTARTVREPPITRIPAPLTPLIGRSQELWELRRRIASSRLLTLTGTGGVGKTRLAIEILSELKDDFASGVCFVELAALTDGALVPQAVMDAFGLKPGPRRTVLETLTDRFRNSDLLLVLDNCEHLLQSCAELVGSLLTGCDSLRVLTTSREPLGITGESVWRVPSLSVPPIRVDRRKRDKGDITEAMEYEAVTLFVERARQARSDFKLTPYNLQAVSGVCRRLDGIPLAIELAAARMRSLTVEDVNNNLDRRFHLLSGGSRTALPRHQTLRSLVDWSYDLLSEREKALFVRLSIFSGGWTLKAAEQVCPDIEAVEDSIQNPKSIHTDGRLAKIQTEDILDLLSSLTDKNLILSETFGHTVRYGMLETLRQYAHDRVSELGDLEEMRERHLAHFLALAETAEPNLTREDQQQWMELLDEEHDNLRSALEWSAVRDTESGLMLAAALWRYWYVRGHFAEGRVWITRLLANSKPTQNIGSRAHAIHGAGALACMLGDYSAARAYMEDSLSMFRELSDLMGIALSLNSLGNLYYGQSDYAIAHELLSESLEIKRQLGDQWGIAVSLNNLGSVARDQGEYTAASALHEESLRIRRELADHRGIANTLDFLGSLAYDQGDYVYAGALHEESMAIRRELGDRWGIAWSLTNLGLVADADKNYSASQALHEQSLANFREIGDEQGTAASLCNLGNAALVRTDYDAARSLHEQSLKILRDLGERKRIAASLEGMALALAELGKPGRAARIIGAVGRLREEIGAPLSPSDAQRFSQQVGAARAAYGEDIAFEAAIQEGRALTMGQAIELALQDFDG